MNHMIRVQSVHDGTIRVSLARRYSFILLIFLMMACLSVSVPSHALSADLAEQTATRTMQEIAAEWERVVVPRAAGFSADADIFVEKPSVSNPYSYGSLTDAFLLDGLDMLNFTRWLAGLPGDISLDRSLESLQQASSVVSAANDVLSHAPVKPAGMADDFFLLAEKGTGSSNLSAGYRILSGSIRAYLSDSDPNNIDRLGHRRWVLNPAMQNTMFGYAKTSGGYPYSSMQSFDSSRDRNSLTDYGHVSWPAAGFFPMEFLADDDAWSVSLNPGQYDRTFVNDIQVSLTRARDGKVWTFDATDTNQSGEFFHVETSGYGVPFCIVFRPVGIGSILDGDSFTVHMTGFSDKKGNPMEISQETTFFRLADAVRPAALKILMHPGETLQLRTTLSADGITVNPVQYSVYSGAASATVSGGGLVKAGIPGYAYLKSQPLTGSLQYIQITVRAANPTDPVSSWAQAEYDLARVNGLTGGLDWGFQRPVTRLEFATLAVNLCENLMGESFAAATEPFSDTDNPAVAKAYRAGIIKGTSPTLFTPARSISRQESAVLLMNVQQFLLKTPIPASQKTADAGSGAENALGAGTSMAALPFADDAAIALWAKADVYGAVSADLLKGVAGNRYNPLGSLTREQTFAILQRLYAVFEP